MYVIPAHGGVRIRATPVFTEPDLSGFRYGFRRRYGCAGWQHLRGRRRRRVTFAPGEERLLVLVGEGTREEVVSEFFPDEQRRCSACGGAWIDRLDFAHEPGCLDGGAERRTLALDLERLAGAPHEFTRAATSAEQRAAEALGIYVTGTVMFQQPGESADTATGSTVTVRLQDDGRHRIRFNGRNIPAAA